MNRKQSKCSGARARARLRNSLPSLLVFLAWPFHRASACSRLGRFHARPLPCQVLSERQRTRMPAFSPRPPPFRPPSSAFVSFPSPPSVPPLLAHRLPHLSRHGCIVEGVRAPACSRLGRFHARPLPCQVLSE